MTKTKIEGFFCLFLATMIRGREVPTVKYGGGSIILRGSVELVNCGWNDNEEYIKILQHNLKP